MRAKIIGLFIALIAMFLFFWLMNHSVIEVTVAGAGGAEVQLFSQKNQKTATLKISDGKASKIVSRASYEVSVSQNEASHFSIVRAGGWLRKTRIEVKELKPEMFRRFVGDNPAPCMYLLNNVLASGSCNDSPAKLQLHAPANEEAPTFTKKFLPGGDEQINGIVSTVSGNVMLLYSGSSGYNLKVLHDDGNVSALAAIPDVNVNNQYSLAPHGSGFIVYDSRFSHILYYSAPQATPNRIDVENNDTTFAPLLITSHGQKLLFVYSTRLPIDDPHSQPKDIKTKVIVYDNGKTAEQTYSQAYKKAVACGSNKLCLINENSMDVYDGKRKLYSISGVQEAGNNGNKILVITDEGVINFNADAGSGYFEYSFGASYKYCGVNFAVDRYVLCLINTRSQKVALEIAQSQANNGSIDKKVAKLLLFSEIEDISAYDKYVFITPMLGELIYDAAGDEFIYDPNRVADTKAKIDKGIADLKIDRSTYTIINTAE